ncbi:hypothetical protein HanHA89_Chr08g0289981 [Helianthus annuus]|nr:hypothetical protein HanHA89_Chr08g0289981 [Helianthus annuus]
MAGQSFMEEIDCASFFDHIDDLIEFPPVNDTIPVDCNEFSNIWVNNSDDLQVSDPIFCGGNSDNASDLSAELHVPYEDIVQLEWLSNFVEDSFSGDGLTIKKEDVPVEKDVLVGPHQFQTASPVSVLESSSSSSSSTSYSGSGTIGSKMIPLSPIQRGPQRARTKRPRPTTFNPRDMVDLLSPLVLVPVSGCSETEKNFTSCHGRLFPEYRPAASPTFVPTLHSNSHKKVVEMRTKFGPNDKMVPVKSETEPELIPNINPQAD